MSVGAASVFFSNLPVRCYLPPVSCYPPPVSCYPPPFTCCPHWSRFFLLHRRLPSAAGNFIPAAGHFFQTFVALSATSHLLRPSPPPVTFIPTLPTTISTAGRRFTFPPLFNFPPTVGHPSCRHSVFPPPVAHSAAGCFPALPSYPSLFRPPAAGLLFRRLSIFPPPVGQPFCRRSLFPPPVTYSATHHYLGRRPPVYFSAACRFFRYRSVTHSAAGHIFRPRSKFIRHPSSIHSSALHLFTGGHCFFPPLVQF